MKKSKLFMISLLAGSLMLSSCDMLLPQPGNRKKSNADADSSQAYDSGYQGKKGASKLSEEEWNKAFGFEETLLNRSVTMTMTTSAGTQSASIISEIDHGKVRLSTNTGLYNDEQIVYLHDLRDDGMVTMDVYYQNDDNSFYVSSYRENMDNVGLNFGLIDYPYSAFTYDENEGKYVSSGFTVEVEETDTMLNLKAASIEIKDGLPSTVMFTYIQDEEVTIYTYSASYSKYGATEVSLPEIKPIEPQTLTRPEGEQITFNDFATAFSKVEAKRPTYNYVHIENEYDSEGYSNYSYTGYYVYNQWQIYDDEYHSLTGSDTISGYIMTQDILEEYSGDSLYETYEFYFNNEKSEYSIFAITRFSSISIEVLITYNAEFYVTKLLSAYNDEIQTSTVTWANNDDYKNVKMELNGRSFVGVSFTAPGVSEQRGNILAAGTTLNFDEQGNARMVTTSAITEGGIEERYQEYYGYGYSYDATDCDGEIIFNIYGDGQDFSYIPDSVSSYFVYKYIVEGDEVVIQGNEGDSLRFKYVGPFDEYINTPEIDNPDDFPYAGYYTFENFYFSLSDDSCFDAASQYLNDNCNRSEYQNYYIYISDNGDVNVSLPDLFASGYAEYDSFEDEIVIYIDLFIDPDTYEYTPANGETLVLDIAYTSTSYNLAYTIASFDGYTVYAYFAKLD